MVKSMVKEKNQANRRINLAEKEADTWLCKNTLFQ